MNSREALETLVSKTSILDDTCASLENCIKTKKCRFNEPCETCDDYNLVKTIKQDLDRLETLEKENQELLVNKNVAQKIATKLKNDNDRLKNAIKILNRFISLTRCKNEKTNKWEAHFMYSLAISVLITQQEYELLEEVLENGW